MDRAGDSLSPSFAIAILGRMEVKRVKADLQARRMWSSYVSPRDVRMLVDARVLVRSNWVSSGPAAALCESQTVLSVSMRGGFGFEDATINRLLRKKLVD